MHWKLFLRLTLAVFFVYSAFSSFAQVVPSATKAGESPLAVGVGVSSFNPDWGHGRMLGGALWIDYIPRRVPHYLYGVGLEAEARDISLNPSSSKPTILREDVASGGVIYSWRHFRNFRPYGKFLMGFGNTDYEGSNLVRRHDSRTVTSAGGGLEYRAFRNIWARADYQYQFWSDFFKATKPAGVLNPQGVTVGVTYHLSPVSFRFH